MRYENVCLESVSHSLPELIVTSAEIETRLAPLYQRLRLPEGRLELMTGIAERRFWPLDESPGRISAETAEKAILRSGVDRNEIGALVHGSVCRDFIEPATACGVHHRLGLPDRCAVYDVSNACLGLLNGVVQAANMIELGQIRAGVVVGTENGRELVEATIARLNSDESLSRQHVKAAFASLTIGSASAAIVLCHREISRTGNRLLGGVVRTSTEHSRLCQGGNSNLPDAPGGKGSDNLPSPASGRGAGGEGGNKNLPSPASGRGAGGEGGNASPLLMWTDSETLMREGVAVAREAFDDFLAELNWTAADIDKTFCHQVGRAHRRLLFETLGLDERIDYSTVEYLGNTGSAALPATASTGIDAGHVQPGDRLALLGIGSGINVVMLGVEWHGQ
ncbi:MAG: 3-oxoacyl-ACP synthase III [Pirellulales bacterium]|nr:3-oxoacyl-ACP synthase III [Pirellulales bacterium]